MVSRDSEEGWGGQVSISEQPIQSGTTRGMCFRGRAWKTSGTPKRILSDGGGGAIPGNSCPVQRGANTFMGRPKRGLISAGKSRGTKKPKKVDKMQVARESKNWN